MASAAVIAAVEARVEANWAGQYFGLNTTGDPPTDGTPFLTIQYPVANEEHITLGQVGQRRFRETGGIRFVYSVPRGSGVATWQATLEALLSTFRAAQFDGVTCETVTPPVFDDSNDNGNYDVLRAVVLYYFDLLA